MLFANWPALRPTAILNYDRVVEVMRFECKTRRGFVVFESNLSFLFISRSAVLWCNLNWGLDFGESFHVINNESFEEFS